MKNQPTKQTNPSHARAPKPGGASRGMVQAEAPLALLLGLLLLLAFYAVGPNGLFRGTFVARYFQHPVEHVTAGLFCLGVAILLLRLFHVAREKAALAAAARSTPEEVLAARPRSHAMQRFQAAALASSMDREAFEDFLLREEDAELELVDSCYRGLKVIQWCIPILGFLGTVIGITAAVGNLSPENLESSMQKAIAGLSTAFDTTALALGLSLLLAPGIHAVSQRHQALANRVNQWLRATLKPGSVDGRPQTSVEDLAMAIREQTAAVTGAVAQYAQKTDSMGREIARELSMAAHEVANAAGNSVSDSMTNSASGAAKAVTEAVSKSSEKILERFECTWEAATDRLQSVAGSVNDLATSVRATADQVQGRSRIIGKALQASKDIAALEQALNRNLSTLESSRTWQESLAALTATIAMLQASVNAHCEPTRRVELVQSDPGTNGSSQ